MQTLPRKIAFVGPIASGKTSCADAYIRQQPTSGRRISIADGLRAEVMAALNQAPGAEKVVNRSDLTDRATKETYRVLLQWWGQHRRLTEGTEYWLARTMQTIDEAADDQVVAVDDCRYPNEYTALVHRGFVFVRLQDEGRAPEEEGPNLHLKNVPESERYYPGFSCDYFLPWAPTLSERIVNLKEKLYCD